MEGIEDSRNDWKKAPEEVVEDGIQSTDGGVDFRQKERQLFVVGWKVKRLLQMHICLWQRAVSSFPVQRE